MTKEFIKQWSKGQQSVTMYQVDGKSYVIHSSAIPYPIFKSDETSANYTFSYQRELLECVIKQ